MAIKPLEYFLFRDYSIAVKEYLKKNLYLSNYPDDENISVFYSPLKRAWSKFLQPVVNGGTLSPNANFILSNYTYSSNDMLGTFKEPNVVGNNIAERVEAPLIYELEYKITMYTRRQSEMDVLLYQLLTSAPKRRPYATIVNGQWCLMNTESPTNETNLEPGELQDRITRASVALRIPRAYLPLKYEEETIPNSFEFDIPEEEL